MNDKSRVVKVTLGAAAGVALIRLLTRRPRVDPVHAPGHRHRGPAPSVADPPAAAVDPARNQPWVRTSHSDSQQRRYRR